MIVGKKTTAAENSFSFEIMGEQYMVKGTDQPEYMESTVKYLEGIISDIMNSNPKLTKTQVAVLAALKIADEFQKLRQEYQYLEQKPRETKHK